MTTPNVVLANGGEVVCVLSRLLHYPTIILIAVYSDVKVIDNRQSAGCIYGTKLPDGALAHVFLQGRDRRQATASSRYIWADKGASSLSGLFVVSCSERMPEKALMERIQSLLKPVSVGANNAHPSVFESDLERKVDQVSTSSVQLLPSSPHPGKAHT
jgi:hypothetical protein